MTVVLQKQLEKQKQDDAISDLSDILGDLKGMAVDMGTELDRLVLLILACAISD